MSLTPQQKQRLIANINNININQAIPFFIKGEISLDEVPNISAERRQAIENAMPSPADMEWNRLQPMLGIVSQDTVNALASFITRYPGNTHADEARAIKSQIEDQLPTPASTDWDDMQPLQTSELCLQQLSAYIQKYEGTRPKGNHVDEAKSQMQVIRQALEGQRRQQEEADWNAVDKQSTASLTAHLNKYPNSVHRNDIDNTVYSLTDKENVNNLQSYLGIFPQGLNAAEARSRIQALAEWKTIKNCGDIFQVARYISTHSQSPYIAEANILLLQLKQHELDWMRTSPDSYDVNKLKSLLSSGIFSENELICEKVATQHVFNIINGLVHESDLPRIADIISNTPVECKDKCTDVYFFGIPSTGKTCVLMGLTSTDGDRLDIDTATASGRYAQALLTYTEAGRTVPHTPGNFITTIHAKTIDNEGNGVTHKLNLVEMSGEEFAIGIVDNPDGEFTFEDMGTGATELLKNNNPKMFFIVIDPSASIVHVKREIKEVDPVTGSTTTRLDERSVNQKMVLKKFVDILRNPQNAGIMKKVTSLHIIMTKADLLGDPLQRQEKAMDIFYRRHKNMLVPIKEVCQQYNINANTQYKPKLYTFSLGNFYIGDTFEYNSEDSDALVDAIINGTKPEKSETFWDKLKKMVN